MSINFNATATITKTTRWQVNCNYRSACLTPQGKSFPTFVFNSGIWQNLFKESFPDTYRFRHLQNPAAKNNINQFIFNTSRYWQAGMQELFFLGISYRFGKIVKKPADDKLQFDNNLYSLSQK